MKNIIISLVLIFLNQNISYSQNEIKKTTSVQFDINDYKRIINTELKKLDVKWIYYKPVIINIKSNQSSIPPPPPNILTFNKDTIEFNQKDFSGIQILRSVKIFEKIDRNKIEDTYQKRKKEFGIGVVFSIPYKWEGEQDVYIDYEIINWNYLCGTGAYNTIRISDI